jgi:hypothetical protein
VANDGVITALDGAANQYVRGDGTLAKFPTSTGGGSSVNYYLNGSVNQGNIAGSVYYQMSRTPVIGTGTNFSTSANGLIAQFITDANDPDSAQIPAGNWNLEFYMSVSASSGALASFYVEIYKYNGSNFTLIASNSATPEQLTNTTTVDAYYTTVAVPATSMAVTDRVMIRVFVNVASKTVTLYTENSRLSEIITTFSNGITSINNLTNQSQYLTVGTAGSDFNIVSSGDTHTFNIPNAGSGTRGLITSGAQTIAGAKSFGDLLTAANLNVSSVLTVFGNLSNGTYSYTLPAANGQLALTSQIPSLSGTAYQVPRYNLAGTNLENSSILDTGTPTGSPSGQVIINSRVTTNNYAEINRYLSIIQNTDSSWALPSSGTSLEAFITSVSSSVLISDTAYLRPRKASDDTFKRFVIQGDDLILNDTTSRRTLINKAGYAQTTTKLEVAGYTRFDSNVNLNGTLYFNATDASQPTYLQNSSGNVTLLTTGQITLGANSTNNFVFNNGNLYLNAEDGRLIGGTNVGRLIASNSDITAYLTIHGSSFATPNKIDLATNSSIHFYTGSSYSQAMAIFANGRIGIGTNTATQKLQIGDGTATSEQYVRIFNSASDIYLGQSGSNLFGAGNGQAIVTGPTYTSNFAIGTTNASANLIFGTNNIERLRIASNGVASFSSNVGIGTNTPISKLHVNLGADDNVHIGTLTASPTGRALIIETNIYGGSINTYSAITSSFVNTIINSSEGANVGIGTQTPSSKLHILGSSNPLIIASYDNTNLVTTYRYKTTYNLGYIGNGAGVFSGGDDIHFAIGAVSSLLFATLGSERMRITNTGNLLIGTTVESTLAKLQVSGDATFSNSITATKVISIADSGGVAFTARARESDSRYAFIAFQNNLGTFDNALFGTEKIGTNGGELFFYTKPDGGSLADRMRINSAGNVLIGTTTDNGAKLQVNGAATFSSSVTAASFSARGASSGYNIFRRDTDVYAGGWYSPSGSILLDVQGVGTALAITSGGNVGIGTSAPILTAANRTTLDINGTNQSILVLSNGGTYKGYLYNDGTNITLNAASALVFATTENERMRITSGGNVGIGNSSPIARLNVSADNNDANSGQLVLNGTTDGNKRLSIGYNTTSNFGFISVYTALSGYNALALQPNGGNVGIGTSSPSDKLTVIGNATIDNSSVGTANLRLKGVGTTTGFDIQSDSNDGYLWNRNSGNIYFGTNNTERMRITSVGDLLVATTISLNGAGTDATNGFRVAPNGTIVNNSTADANAYFAKRSGYSSSTFVAFYVAGTYVGAITTNGSATSYTTASDYRLKQDLKEYNGLDLISKIKTYDYQWKSDNTRSFGVIAHELKEIIPQAVNGEKDGKEMQGVDYSKIVPILVKAIQEQQAQIEELKELIKNK